MAIGIAHSPKSMRRPLKPIGLPQLYPSPTATEFSERRTNADCNDTGCKRAPSSQVTTLVHPRLLLVFGPASREELTMLFVNITEFHDSRPVTSMDNGTFGVFQARSGGISKRHRFRLGATSDDSRTTGFRTTGLRIGHVLCLHMITTNTNTRVSSATQQYLKLAHSRLKLTTYRAYLLHVCNLSAFTTTLPLPHIASAR